MRNFILIYDKLSNLFGFMKPKELDILAIKHKDDQTELYSVVSSDEEIGTWDSLLTKEEAESCLIYDHEVYDEIEEGDLRIVLMTEKELEINYKRIKDG